ncbi:hypothetical protein GO988_13185 [Hymenobacter sp. HMF4947]|uniref:ABC transporter permease n=1 Tax=Hymenobacter ginkgonis TaxID=2682976 RepID=A0A7K1TFV4_9BACT|nr:hypothetical protein [Hymenobacter ginkgonis]MVN77283.1 hypothetical protein [Hymenobacter ginkgonis]
MAAPVAAYLRLRLRALARLAREIGWLRLVLLLPLLALATMQALVVAAGHPVGRWAAPLVVASLLLTAHRQRADWQFLATTAPGFRRWLAVEYAGYGLPVALLLLALHAAGPAILLLLLAPLVAWAPPTREGRATQHRGRSLFRSEAFEWVSGMRAAKALLLWPLLLGGAAWPRANALGPVLTLVVWLLVVMACYGAPEPSTMLAVAARQPGQFIRRRLGLGLAYAALTVAPFLALLGSWPLALGLGLYWLGLVALTILAKYAFYPNAVHIKTIQALVLVVVLLLVGHPAYPPLLVVVVGGLIWQSHRRLRAVLGQQAGEPKQG